VRKSAIFGFVFVTVAALTACDRPNDAVVVYVSADQHIARPILETFTRDTGIAIRPLFDTEATKTTGLASRLRREHDAPKADVFWSSEPFAVNQLAEEGVLQAVASDVLDAHPARWRDPEGRWFAFAGRARIIVFNPNVLAEDDRPEAWMDLVRERFRDQLVMADPRFGTTRGHLGAFKAYADRAIMPGYFEAWLEGLRDNGIRLLPGGNAAVVDAVARGEALVGCTDTDDVFAAQARGVEVAFIYPRHNLEGTRGGGTLLVPNAAGVVAGSERRADAIRLVEYLASAQVEAALHASVSHNVPIAHATELSVAATYIVAQPLDVSIGETSAAMDAAVDEAMRVLQGDRE
jgi:iron(III) transport system substrate-binding protein